MYYLTQILKHKVDDSHAMFLGFSDDLKTTYFLTEELSMTTDVFDDYKAFEPYPFLIDLGFFSAVDYKKLLEYVDNDILKQFIKSGGTNAEAKTQLLKELGYVK